MNKYILGRLYINNSKAFLVSDKNGLIGWIIFKLVNGKYTRTYTGERMTKEELLSRLSK